MSVYRSEPSTWCFLKKELNHNLTPNRAIVVMSCHIMQVTNEVTLFTITN